MGLFSSKKHYLNQVGFEQHQQEQPKRISTSAGHRLSVILENGGSQSQAAKAREAHRASVRKSGLSAVLADVPEDRSASAHSSGYSYNVWSENEKLAALRNHKQIAKRGGWKRILSILAILLLLIIALAVGLAVGLKKKPKPESALPATSTAAPGTSSPSTASPESDSPPSPTSTSTPSLPANFPLGTFSLITFLDTIQTNCTSNPLTWTCYPYTTYYDAPSKALATFDWTISGSPSAYKISSTNNPFSLSFKNAPLELLDKGLASERYRFQIAATKTVTPASNLTDDNAAVDCDFRGNLQANLYTRMEKEYPSDQDPSGSPSYTTWPFAVKIEESAPGGQGVPSCYRTTESGQHGKGVEGLEGQSETTLCSCLYKNWHTPS